MRTLVIDDEFFNHSAIEATPRISRHPVRKKALTPQTLLEMSD
jgi:hypothetical protein